MFIQLHTVYKDSPDRSVLVNVSQIAYVESDTESEWCSVYFHGVAIDRADDANFNSIAVREPYKQIVERILAAQFTPPPVATT
jgi:hypothetical protein